MIIGISGKKGSGKDLVAEIIQRLQVDHENNVYNKKHGISRVTNTVGDLVSGDKREVFSDWEVKRFADKLKDMVCVLIGCTREQLEDREFKEKELGEEWRVWYNENTFLQTKYSSEESLREVFHWIKGTNKDEAVVTEVLTPRKILQLLGTNGVRDIIHPNAWVNALMSEYKDKTETYTYSGGDLDGQEAYVVPESMWLIPDMRFPNELKAIEDRKGITIRVERPDLPEDNHPSETALDEAEFDYIIENSGSIEDLIDMVKQLLQNEKIID